MHRPYDLSFQHGGKKTRPGTRIMDKDVVVAFTNKKVNMLNYRKEFFNVTIDEIAQKVKEIGFEAEFSQLPEVMEYMETLAVLDKLNAQIEDKTGEELISEEFR